MKSSPFATRVPDYPVRLWMQARARAPRSAQSVGEYLLSCSNAVAADLRAASSVRTRRPSRGRTSSSSSFHWDTSDGQSKFNAEGWSPPPGKEGLDFSAFDALQLGSSAWAATEALRPSFYPSHGIRPRCRSNKRLRRRRLRGAFSKLRGSEEPSALTRWSTAEGCPFGWDFASGLARMLSPFFFVIRE